MTAEQKRKSVADKYSLIIGRNLYNQNLRDYCYKPYIDGNYYSDCSSSISYAYKEAGLGFGILNTAGMYNSSKLSFVDVNIKDGVPTDFNKLRVGDMLLFAGSDASRPQKIGHVEMVYSINSNGTVTICGHGSGNPSYKDLTTYCKQRYNSWATGGWRKGLVCIKRYIQDDIITKNSGWYEENGRWRFYLGDTGKYITSDWYQWTGKDGKKYWSYFLDTGFAVQNNWYKYKEEWYFFHDDCRMAASEWITWKNKYYYLDSEGKMVKDCYVKSVDKELWYYIDSTGVWETSKDTKYKPQRVRV